MTSCMPDVPPTSPGPMPPRRLPRANTIVLGMSIHAVATLIPCIAVPLAMGSNIWPIAGVFWAVLTVPAAIVTGGLTGLLARKLRRPIATTVIITTGLAVAIAVGIIIANNR